MPPQLVEALSALRLGSLHDAILFQDARSLRGRVEMLERRGNIFLGYSSSAASVHSGDTFEKIDLNASSGMPRHGHGQGHSPP